MAILGNNVKGASTRASTAGRMALTTFNLGSALTLTELHGWVGGTTAHYRIVIYADNGGTSVGGALLANTGSYAVSGSDIEIAETGFSVALAAGNYWIGWISDNTGGLAYYDGSSGSYQESNGNTYTPPPATGPTTSGSGTRNFSCWGVVGAAAGPAFVPRIAIL